MQFHRSIRVSLSVGMLSFAVLAAWLTGGAESSVSAAEKGKPVRILFLTQSKGYMHGSVKRDEGQELAPAEIAMKQLGQQTGLFVVDATQDAAADFTKENLQRYDIVMFYTTGVLPISDEARDYFVNDWLKQKGHGFMGFHSATDTYRTEDPAHKWYWDIVGGTFNGHPWGSGTTVTVTVHDPDFPAMKPFGHEFSIKDEIYQYVHWAPENVHVLASLDMAKCNPMVPCHVPVTWCRAWGDGKIYYTNLGHNNGTWTNPAFLKSTENAIRWILNELPGDATPNPQVSAGADAASKKAAEAAGAE